MERRWRRAVGVGVLTLGLGMPHPAVADPPAPSPATLATVTPPPPAPSAADIAATKVEAALDNALTLVRPGQIGLATVWDGNIFVQCRRVADGWIACEGAGPALQPSLARVITLERAYRLFALGWLIDVHFGSYLRMFPGGTPTRTVARQVVRALDEGYGADLPNLELRTSWVRDVKCPPRNGPGQNLAGSIDDAPAMARTALHACVYPPAVLGAMKIGSTAAFLGLYGQRVKGEIQRLIVNSGSAGIHLVLSGPTGYVQCEPDTAPPSIYCEAASADAMPALAKLLTPERVAELHAHGFVDPGRVPNYARSTPLAQADARLLTLDLLTLLFDVYAYRGNPLLVIATEEGQ